MAGLENGWIPVVRRLYFETGHRGSGGLDDSNGSKATIVETATAIESSRKI